MTKEEIATKMKELGILEVSGSRHELWMKAFDMYNAIPGNQRLSPSCGNCYNILKRWLKS